MWKPLLWFVKGSRLRTLDSIEDLIDWQPPVLHDDGDLPADAKNVISKLTVQDDLVFDPLMGAARTGIAALRLKRRFIGSEKDKDTLLHWRKQLLIGNYPTSAAEGNDKQSTNNDSNFSCRNFAAVAQISGAHTLLYQMMIS